MSHYVREQRRHRSGTMTKRGHNEGTVLQDETTGKPVGKVLAGYGEDGKRCRNKRAARTKPRRSPSSARSNVRSKTECQTRRANLTVADLLDFDVEIVVVALYPSPNTVENCRWSIGRHFKPTLRWLRSHLTEALKGAERRDRLQRNVARLARIPSSHKTERRSLTREQAQQLLGSGQGQQLETATLVGITRGFRPAVILGLRWGGLEPDSQPPLMHVRQSTTRVNNKFRIGALRTRQAQRTLVVLKAAARSVQWHRVTPNKLRLRRGDVRQDHDLVSEMRTPVDPSYFRREFKELTRSAGLGDWAPHEPKQPAASLLSGADVPIEQVADLLGHKELITLLSVCRHSVAPAIDAGAHIGLITETSRGGR